MIELVAAEQPVRFAEANMNSSPTFGGHKNPTFVADHSQTLTRCRLPSYASSDAIMAAMSEAIAGFGWVTSIHSADLISVESFWQQSLPKLGTPSKNKRQCKKW
jgi:hypothetical protein